MIRIIIICIAIFLFFTVSLFILFPILWVVGKFSPKAKASASLAIVKWAFRTVLRLSGTKVKVVGLERIPKDEAVMFVGNHRSFFDIIIGYSLMKGNTAFIAKKEINKVPILRTWMKYLKCQFLDRHDMKQGLKVILEAIRLIKEEQYNIVIFPEGTRNKGEGVMEFKEGSFKIADKSGCKIVPMVQCGNECIFENQFPKIRKARTIIEFGEPIDVSTLSKEERKHMGAYTRDIVAGMYERNMAELESMKRG